MGGSRRGLAHEAAASAPTGDGPPAHAGAVASSSVTGDGPDVPAPGRGIDARTAGSSFLWSAVSFGASKLLVFLVTLVLARLLVPEDFGVVAVGLAIVAFLEVALDLGVGSALIYEQERGITRRVQTAFTLNLGIAIVCTAAGIAAAPLVGAIFDVDDTTLLRVLFLYFLLKGLVQVPDAVLRRDLAFRRRAGIEVSRAITRGAVSVPLAMAGAGPWALVVGILASEFVGVVLTWLAVGFFPTFRLERTVARTLLGFGSAVLTMKIMGAVLENSDFYIVGSQLGTRALGIYTLAYRIPELVLANVFWIFSSVAFSLYARARSTDMDDLRAAAMRALQMITLFAFPAGVGMAVVSLDLTVSLLGREWEDAALPMLFICLSMAAASIGYASGDVFPAVGRPGLLIKILAPMVGVKVAGMMLAAPYGLSAMAATLFGITVTFAGVRLVVANRVLRVSLGTSLRALMPGAVAAVGAAAGALPVVLLRPTGVEALLLAIPAGFLSAVALLFLLCRPALRELRHLTTAMRADR